MSDKITTINTPSEMEVFVRTLRLPTKEKSGIYPAPVVRQTPKLGQLTEQFKEWLSNLSDNHIIAFKLFGVLSIGFATLFSAAWILQLMQ